MNLSSSFAKLLQNLTPTQTERDQAASHRESVINALKKELSVSRFFQSGSFTHGTGVRGHCDVDAIVSLSGVQYEQSIQNLREIRSAMVRRFPFTNVTIDRPAVRIEFAKGNESWELIPAFIHSADDGRLVYQIPGPSSNDGWILSSPDAHLAFVDYANAEPRGGAKSLARLLKGWKYSNNVPISSFYLEMRAAIYMRSQSNFIAYWDLKNIFNILNLDNCPPLPDPSGLSDPIRAFASDSDRTISLANIYLAAIRSQKAHDAHLDRNDNLARFYWKEIYGSLFPSS